MEKRNQNGRIRTIGSSVLLSVSLIIMIISTRSLVGVPEKIGLSVYSFFQKGFSAVGSFLSETVTSIGELRRLQASYDDLLERIEQYGNLETEYANIKRENERLSEQLGYINQSSFNATSAKIIAKDPENLYSTIVLNKGTNQGIVKNQAVVAYQNGVEGLVGRVIEVSQNSCVVSPVYDGTSHVAARLEQSRYDGLISGSGSIDIPLTLNYIRKRAEGEIQYGDLVITSGLQSLYPSGVSIGRVSKINVQEYLASLEIEVEPILDFGRLEYVFIVNFVNSEGGEQYK